MTINAQTGEPRSCEACGDPLCLGGDKSTGLCQRCRTSGARFAREWMAGLREAGLSSRQIGEVVGTTDATVRTRLSERRRLRSPRSVAVVERSPA